jgi:hypothetical protein
VDLEVSTELPQAAVSAQDSLLRPSLRGWQSAAWSVGAEADTGGSLRESRLTACLVASTGQGLPEELRAPGKWEQEAFGREATEEKNCWL